jgi:DNA ligase-1
MTALFDVLSSRKVTGNAAKALVLAFLTHHGIKEEAELEVFCRLLDRNLVAGFGARTLMQVQWQTSPVSSPSNASTPIIASTSAGKKPEAASPRNTAEKADPAASQQSVAPTTRSLKAFSCALGKTVLPPFSTLFKGGVTWYASRKLDGVRCITFIDFDVSDVQAPAFVQVQHLSRTGKPFFTLGNLEPQLRLIEGYPGLREMLEKDIELVEDLEQKGRTIKRLVLDGEVCVMVPSPTAPAHAPQSSGTDSDDEHDSFTQLWSDTGLVEDFPATVSEIRRQHHTIARPAYYLFDLLSYAEFAANTSLPRIPGLGKTFSVRMTDLQNLCAWLSNEGQGDASIIKALKQQVVTKEEDVEGMVETAARSGWEGLVLRADKGYVGKRRYVPFQDTLSFLCKDRDKQLTDK